MSRFKDLQKNLFGGFEEAAPSPAAGLPEIPEWPDKEKAQGEKEVLGFYLSTHPLAEHRRVLETYRSHTTADIPGLPERSGRRPVPLGQCLSTNRTTDAALKQQSSSADRSSRLQALLSP